MGTTGPDRVRDAAGSRRGRVLCPLQIGVDGIVSNLTVEHGPSETEDRIVIYPRRWKQVLFALGALVFVVAGFLIGVANGWQGNLGVLVAIYVGVPFFGLCFLYLIFRIAVPRPALIVSDEGILDNASVVGAGLIRWDEVKDIRATSFGTERVLVIVPKDETTILARQNPVKRRLMRMNKSLANCIVCIPGNILPMTCEELRDQIRQYRKARRRRRRIQS